MREEFDTGFVHVLLFKLGIFEKSHVCGGFVTLAVDGDNLVISVRDNVRCNYN